MCRALPQSVGSVTVLRLYFCTARALTGLWGSCQLCCSPSPPVGWINKGAEHWAIGKDSHEGAGAGKRAFPGLRAWPEARCRGGRLYVVAAEPCRCHHAGTGMQDARAQGVIVLLGLGFSRGLSRWPEPPQRGREPFPLPLGPWEGSARLPLTYHPALSFSSSPFPQHSQAFSWYHTGCSASLHEARTSSD